MSNGGGGGIGGGAASGAAAGTAVMPGWGTVIGGALGAIGGAMGGKQGSPTLAQNMSDMAGIFAANSGLTAAGGYRDLGPASYYPGQTVADFSPYTQAGINSLYNVGANSSPTLGYANNYLQGALGGQYLNSNPANAQLGQMAGSSSMGGYNTVAPQLQQIAGQAGSLYANPAYGGLTAFGNGTASNPYLNQMYGAASRSVTDQFRNAIAPSLASTFSLAGRTGSGAQQGAFGQATQSLGNTLGDLGANLYGNAYESNQNRQLSALNSLGGLYNTGIGNQMAALSQLNNAYNQGYSNQLGALNQLSSNYNVERGLQNAALGQLPNTLQAQLAAANAQIQAGNLLDTHQQDLLNAAKAQYDFGQTAPRDYYSNLVGLYGGVQPARVQGQPVQPYNTTAGLLGGALVGSRLGSVFGGGNGSQLYGSGGFGTGVGGSYPDTSVFASADPYQMPDFSSLGSSLYF